jgi:predicted transcriptional regulator of viral defense system
MTRKKAEPKLQKAVSEMHDADVEHIVEALGRIKNPAVRYFLSMMIDALTEDLAEIEAGRPPMILTRSRSN